MDNYSADDLYVPKPRTKAVADTLERYGLRTKPVEPANSARSEPGHYLESRNGTR